MTPGQRRDASPGHTGPQGETGEGPRPGLAPEEEAPELSFAVSGARVLEYAAVPTLAFDLRVEAGEVEIRSLSLNAQVQIAATRRRYERAEEVRLYDLFGAPREWGRSLRALQWARVSFVIPSFRGSATCELHLPCSYDFDVAAHKYLNAVRDGVIPLEFLFSGSVFYRGPGGALRTVRLPWDREADFQMPARLWHETMERYFPNSAWLRVRRDVFERLLAFRSGQGLPTWEAALEALLPDDRAAPGEDAP